MIKDAANRTIGSSKRRIFVSVTALVAAGAFMNADSARAVDDHADWDDVQIVEGQGSVTDTGLGSTTIDQHSMRAIGEAQELHIGKMGSVQINQNSKDALFVGRVVGNHSDPTQILGRLSADGRVMIIDRNGVFFGQDSVVDAAGIAATTGDVSNADIMDGNENFTFSNFGNGEIVLEGTMNVQDAGLAAFVAPNVRNSGVVNAKMGSVVFAGGEKVTLDLYGDGLVEVAVDGQIGQGLLENKGTINAEGGTVVMTAQSARDVVDNVINNEGVINVSSISQKGGKIILSGGDQGKVSNAGKLDASGAQGGSVKVTGQAVELGSASEIKANATSGEAGKIEVLADETLAVAGKLNAQGEGKSGFIETSAPDVSFTEGTEIKAGKWLLDPTSIVVDATLEGVLETQLASGDAEITTPAAGSELGRITFVSTVDWNTANTFTANAIDDIFFNGGGGLNATGGGHIVLNSDDDIRMFNTSTGILSNGGNITLNAHDEVSLRGGVGIDAAGGNIIVNNQTGGFYGFAESVRTGGTGTITLNQVKDTIENPSGTVTTIQNAIDAIDNTGTGQNTINIGSGTYDEQVTIDHDHLALIGKPGDPTVPGAASDAPLIQGTSTTSGTGITVVGALSDVKISGLKIDKFKTGIRYDIGSGTVIPGTAVHIDNNTITNVDQGIFTDEVADVTIAYNDIDAKNLGAHVEDFSDTTASIENNVFKNTRGPLTGVGVSIRDIGSDDDMSATVRRNQISGFGAGVALDGLTTATPDNVSIEENFITGNSTGILVHSNSNAATAHAFNNDLSGNTLAVNNAGAGAFNASGNWFGTTDEASVIALTSGAVDVSPYLGTGTDTELGIRGFQGDFSTLYVTDDGAQTSGLINEAIGLVTPHGQIFVNDGLYTENILVNKSLKMTGLSTAVLNPESPGDALMTITASDVNIDPLVFDGLGIVKHGIIAQGQGTHNLTIDGNTFRNFKKSAMLLKATSAGNMNVINNIVEGSMGQGIQVGTIQKGTVLNIANNIFGSEADPLNYIGVDLGRVRNSSVFIDNNIVHAKNRGISVTHTTGSSVNVTNNTVRSVLAAVNFHGIENGSNVLISGNDLVSSNGTGAQFTTGPVNPANNVSASTVTIDDNTNIEGQGGYGVDFFPGDLQNGAVINITNNEAISGLFDGIYVGDSIFGGVTVNISGNGAGLDTPDGYVGIGGITGQTGNGISLYGIETSDIRDNYIHDVGQDGIHVDIFGQSWIAYNYIDGAGDDGIEGVYGGFASVYGNTIKHIGIGVPPLFAGLAPEALIEFDYEFGADGIHLRNVGDGILPPLTDGELGFGYSLYGADSEIYGNDISLVADDGIEVINGNISYIGNNVIGHVNGDGIAVESTPITEINGNVVTLALGNGIYVNGLSEYDLPVLIGQEEITLDPEYTGIYAGIFNNKILLTGKNGIEVTNIDGGYFPGDVTLLGASGYGDYGWAVNIQGNEVALTGEHGIYAHQNRSVRAHENEVFAAGLGEGASFLVEVINTFASAPLPEFAPAAIEAESVEPTSFGWFWGDGDGIRVENTFGFGPTGESVDVQYNTVLGTGGHGISVFGAPTARVSYNNVAYNGIAYTEIPGFADPFELLSSGPFDDHSGYFGSDPVLLAAAISDEPYNGDSYPTRRDLWSSSGESLLDILTGYIPAPSVIEYDSHDGIHVEDVSGLLLPATFSGPGDYDYGYDLPYSVIIQGNTIDHTGDDGVEVLFSGRTLIGGYGELEGNHITNAGFGTYGGSYGPDATGADGIHVAEVFTGFIGMAGIAAGGEDVVDGGYYGYAVDVIGNTIDSTQDDGVEVEFSESTLIANNNISNVGLGDLPNGREFDEGADGINVSFVGLSLMAFSPEAAPVAGETSGVGVDPYSVVVIGNNISHTQDDGIEVYNSGRTKIGGMAEGEGNVINHVGYGSGYDFYETWGADGIHVRNVFSDPYTMASAGGMSGDPSDHFYDVQVIGNTVSNTADDGIQVAYSGDTLIGRNTLTDIGYLLPLAEVEAGKSPRDAAYSGYGFTDMWGADGIHVIVGEGEIYDDPVDLVSQQLAFQDEIIVDGFNKTVIVFNDIDHVLDDGIETLGVTDLLVDSNEVRNIGDDGINILGFGGFPVNVPEEQFEVALAPSIYAPLYSATVTNNTVDNTGGDGIQSEGYDYLDVSDNDVSNTYFNGLYISGFYNGYVSMQGNTFTDNGHIEEGELVGAGARFESGNIDMSDLSRPNFFVNTRGVKALGMQFDPAEMIYAGFGEILPESIVPTANLTIVNETLGSTVFDGYSPTGSFYVRFEDGAILDEFGNVIVIDGTNATFDGILPASTGGVLSASDLNFIEERLWDADDPLLDGRGQIFVGVPAPVGLDNIQDFFNQFESGAGQSNGLNVTFLGLPPIGPLGPGAGLNNIAPAAGGEDEGQGQQQTPQNLAGISPEAGGSEQQGAQSEQVGCWSDLTNALGSGKTASITDNGTPEDAMNAALNCGNQQI